MGSWRLRGFFLADVLQRLVQNRIRGRRGRAELGDLRFIDRNRRLEPLLVQLSAGWCEETGDREPETRAVGQLHELPLRGASDRVLADELGALVPDERR